MCGGRVFLLRGVEWGVEFPVLVKRFVFTREFWK